MAFLATTPLLRAAETAPEDDRKEFVDLVTELDCGKRKVQDLLLKGELWSNWKRRVDGTKSDDSLASFFDYCNRETQASPVSKQPGGILFYFFLLFW